MPDLDCHEGTQGNLKEGAVSHEACSRQPNGKSEQSRQRQKGLWLQAVENDSAPRGNYERLVRLHPKPPFETSFKCREELGHPEQAPWPPQMKERCVRTCQVGKRTTNCQSPKSSHEALKVPVQPGLRHTCPWRGGGC